MHFLFEGVEREAWAEVKPYLLSFLALFGVPGKWPPPMPQLLVEVKAEVLEEFEGEVEASG